MSATEILRTQIGNTTAVFRTGRGRNRGGCSCGWDGPLRMMRAWAVIDAYGHGGRSPACLPSVPLLVDESVHHRLSVRALLRKVTPWPVIVASILLLIPAGLAAAPEAGAAPRGCEEILWGFLGSQRRLICDGPIRADGSWERYRIIGIPAHYRNPRMSCSSGSYTSNCTFYPGGWVEQQNIEETSYIVFPHNVLPNEPGHLG